MIIPVNFLAYRNKDHCIGRDDIEWDKDHDWSYGFRGSSVIKPSDNKKRSSSHLSRITLTISSCIKSLTIGFINIINNK